MQWFRSLLFTLLFFANSLLHAAIILLSALFFGRRYSDAQSRSWGRSNLQLLKSICRLDYVVEGTENVPREGAHITFWKHSSAWETLLVMFLFPPQSWVLKREVQWIPLVGWATMLYQPIAINRGAGHVASAGLASSAFKLSVHRRRASLSTRPGSLHPHTAGSMRA